MIAYCGLACDSCPIHLATLEKDLSLQAKMRDEIAVQLSNIYGLAYQPGNISDCDGCLVKNGRLFQGCFDCEIRKCAIEKELVSCACCNSYVCNKLKKHFDEDPESEESLHTLSMNISDRRK